MMNNLHEILIQADRDGVLRQALMGQLKLSKAHADAVIRLVADVRARAEDLGSKWLAEW